MNLLATTLVMGILFLPGSTPTQTPVAHASTPSATASTQDEPSPRTVAKAANPADATLLNTYHLKLTAYNAVASQTDGDPTVTASGVRSNSEVIAARSQDLGEELPFGTVIQITRAGDDTPGCNFHKIEDQVGYRVIADTMNARFTNRLDVELDSSDTVTVEGHQMNPAAALGLCYNTTVKVVGHIPLSQIPKTQAGLASLFAPREIALNK